MSKRTYLKRYKKQMLDRGDKWACHYCGVQFVPAGTLYGDPEYFTPNPEGSQHKYNVIDGYSYLPSVDHITPKSKGGSDDLSNLVFACYVCNTKKHIKPYEQFVQGGE